MLFLNLLYRFSTSGAPTKEKGSGAWLLELCNNSNGLTDFSRIKIVHLIGAYPSIGDTHNTV